MNRHDVAQHWFSGPPGSLIARLDAGLAAAGLDPRALRPEDLAAVDEFHMRGREATVELATLAGFERGQRVVDVGSGLGGPARYLATACGCTVEGVDLTEEYCRTATELARRVGLADRARFRQGDALALPFADATFDGAWTQHISMNLPDKRAFFAEMARVVKPGGRLALYDPIAGPAGLAGFRLPVPWARVPGHSHLIDADATRARLEDAGWTVLEWRDVSELARAWFEARLKAATAGPSPLGLHLLLGADWPTMAGNLLQNLSAGRVQAVQVIARRR